MTTTLAALRSYVRDHLDLSVDEMPNTLVDSFVQDASNQIDGYERNWTFQAGIWELTTLSGQTAYTNDDLVDLSNTGTFKIQKIAAIYDHLGNLLPYKGRATSPTGRVAGPPGGWTDWGTNISILPPPDASYTLQVYGYRQAAEWIGASPDGTEVSPYPQEFTEVLRQWALGRAYAQQEEGATAVAYYDLANRNLDLLSRKYQATNPIQNLYMNQGNLDTVAG